MDANENCAAAQKSACAAQQPPIEERSRPTGSQPPPERQATAAVNLTHLKSGQIIVAVSGFSEFPEISGPRKKVVDGNSRAEHKPPPSPTTKPLTIWSKRSSPTSENGTGQEPKQLGDGQASLFLIVG
jgi:hypothetical protein